GETYVSLLSPYVGASLGHVRALCGRAGEGVSFLEQALNALESMGSQAFSSVFLVYLGEAYLLADRVDEAHSFAGRALKFARERDERGFEALALRCLGEIAAHRDPSGVKKSEDHYGQALALANELGMRPLVAHCHLGLGKLDRRTGKRHEAQEHLTVATTMYREMDMRFWLEQAESELTAL